MAGGMNRYGGQSLSMAERVRLGQEQQPAWAGAEDPPYPPLRLMSSIVESSRLPISAGGMSRVALSSRSHLNLLPGRGRMNGA